MIGVWITLGLLAIIGVTVIAMLYADKRVEEHLKEKAENDAENLKKQRDVKHSPNVLSAVDRLRKNRK